ncbi:hypothetical protein D6789_01565 [Candidatus Woesearchaeota archaeon]|nr:MAG: hypothetical protein D6789_01565 [Candidatus Woesearchaeota archaeon]
MGFMNLFKKKAKAAPAPAPPKPGDTHDETHIDDLGDGEPSAVEPAQTPPWMRDSVLDTSVQKPPSPEPPAQENAQPAAPSSQEPFSAPTDASSDTPSEAPSAAPPDAPSAEAPASPEPQEQAFQEPSPESSEGEIPTFSDADIAAVQAEDQKPGGVQQKDENAQWKPPVEQPTEPTTTAPAQEGSSPETPPLETQPDDAMELPPLEEPDAEQETAPQDAPRDYLPLEQYQALLADLRIAKQQLTTARGAIKQYTKRLEAQKQPYVTFAEAVNALQHELISMDNILLKQRGD